MRLDLSFQDRRNFLPLEGQTYLAGRKEDCDILLPADTGISREHFQISYENSQWKLAVVSKFGFILSGGAGSAVQGRRKV